MAPEKYDVPGANRRCYLVGESPTSLALADQDDGRLHLVNVSTWPPTSKVLDRHYVNNVEWSRGGRMLVVWTDKAEEAAYGVRVYDGDSPTDLPAFSDERRDGFKFGAFLGEDPVAWPSPRHPYPTDVEPAPWRPVMLRDGAWVEHEALEPVTSDPNLEVVFGSVSLGDGRDVLAWNGDGYEASAAGMEKTFTLGATHSRTEWSYAPAGADGFFYLSGRKLFEAHRGAEPARRIEGEVGDNIIKVTPGPEGKLLLRAGVNPYKALGFLYDPAADRLQPISSELVGQKRVEGLRWSEPLQRILAVGRETITTVSAADLAAVPSTEC